MKTPHEYPRRLLLAVTGLSPQIVTWTLAPFLHLGQWLHVGKEATFGLGGYRFA